MKKIITLALVLLMLMVGCTEAEPVEEKEDVKTIGVLLLVTHPALDATIEGMVSELEAMGFAGKFKIVIENANGDAPTADLIAKQFVSDKVDLIYAIATPAAQAAFNATQGTDIPVVFNAVTDAVAAGIVASNDAPGGNVTGVSDAAPLDLQLQLIRDLLPEAKKIGMLYNLGEVNGLIQVEQVQALAPQFGLEVIVTGVTTASEMASAAQQIAGEVDAFYNITDNLVVSNTAIVTDKAAQAGIPVFAAEDGTMDQGLLAVDGLSYLKLGNQAAGLVAKILFEGVSPKDLAVSTATDTSLIINQTIANTLNITISDALKARATLID
jgi:putative ABC transport system substrate-binding protein